MVIELAHPNRKKLQHKWLSKQNVMCFLPGAEIRSVCTEAGMFAIRARRKIATEKDFLEAVNKVIKSYAKFSATPRYMTYNWECVYMCVRVSTLAFYCQEKQRVESKKKHCPFLSVIVVHLKIKFIPKFHLTVLLNSEK